MKSKHTKQFFSLLMVLAILLGSTSFATAQGLRESLPDVTVIPETVVDETNSSEDVKDIENAVLDMLNKDDDSNNYAEARVKVVRSTERAYAKSGKEIKKADHLVVYLPHKDTYYYEAVKVVLNDDYSVKDIVRNYKETQEDVDATPERKVSASRDYADVDAVIGITVGSEYPTAVQAHKDMANLLSNAGYTVKVLSYNESTVANYKYWLAQPNVKIFWQVGHGNESGIMLRDGSLNSYWFNSQSSAGFKDKLVYFNSCLVFNDPMRSAVLGTGVQRYIGGIPELLVGPSEKVSLSFMNKVVKQRLGMTPSIRAAEQETNYPDQGAHGIGGSGSDYVLKPNSDNQDDNGDYTTQTTLSSDKEVYQPGDTVNVTAEVGDQDDNAVEGATVKMTFTRPNGSVFEETYTTNSYGKAVSKINSSTSTQLGTFKIKAETSASGYVSSTANITIQFGNQSTDDSNDKNEDVATVTTLSTDKTNFTPGEAVDVTAHVVDDEGSAIEGATVKMTFKRPNGSSFEDTYTTDTYGDAVSSIGSNSNTVLGTYTVKATTSAEGYKNSTSNISFAFDDDSDDNDSDAHSLTADEKQLIALVNQERVKYDLKPFEVSTELAYVARVKSEDMYTNDYFSHTSPTYGSPFDMMTHFGISYGYAAENIAINSSVEGAHKAWMNSAGHRENILNPNLTHIGVGIKDDYYTEMFISQ